MTQSQLAQAARLFTGGYVLVAARDRAGRPRAARASAFNSVSLSPPIVVWVIDASCDLDLEPDHACGVSVLTAAQAARLQDDGDDPMKRLHWQPGEILGAPQACAVAAAFEAVVFDRRVVGSDVICFAQLASYADGVAGSAAVSHGGELHHGAG